MNKVILSGNLGKDVELKTSQGGKSFAHLSLATTDYDFGAKENKTNWHRLTMFGKTAERAEQYLSKGSSIIVEGTIDYQKDREDDKKIWTTILVDKWEFAGKKGDNGGGGDNRSTQSSGNTSNRAQAPAETSSEISDEDIPF